MPTLRTGSRDRRGGCGRPEPPPHCRRIWAGSIEKSPPDVIAFECRAPTPDRRNGYGRERLRRFRQTSPAAGRTVIRASLTPDNARGVVHVPTDLGVLQREPHALLRVRRASRPHSFRRRRGTPSRFGQASRSRSLPPEDRTILAVKSPPRWCWDVSVIARSADSFTSAGHEIRRAPPDQLVHVTEHPAHARIGAYSDSQIGNDDAVSVLNRVR